MVKDIHTTESVTPDIENNSKQEWKAPQITQLTTDETEAGLGFGSDGGSYNNSLS